MHWLHVQFASDDESAIVDRLKFGRGDRRRSVEGGGAVVADPEKRV